MFDVLYGCVLLICRGKKKRRPTLLSSTCYKVLCFDTGIHLGPCVFKGSLLFLLYAMFYSCTYTLLHVAAPSPIFDLLEIWLVVELNFEMSIYFYVVILVF
ncbi:hypothetical protein OUZ56_014206 [Daphnia magna]|uniref:Uncharacterized protein n=1 Tax=Daphnia magna TaxID=35525 RepID=A0ABQ9Z856_9CRUS|nr:hypothetical protein OUZ56_014206 [Daphnia magna]